MISYNTKEGTYYMSLKDYEKTPKDYRGFVDGKPYIVHLDHTKGTIYSPVVLVDELEPVA